MIVTHFYEKLIMYTVKNSIYFEVEFHKIGNSATDHKQN